MVEVRELKRTYVTGKSRVEAVRGINFQVQKGEVFTLLGPSGCGKSTTLRCIAGIESPDSGAILLDGRPVFDSHGRVNVPMSRRGVGMVFQSYAIWPHMSVFDNVVFPLRYGPYKAPRATWRQKVMRALELVQMAEMADRPAPLLSGGQQQRVALARALVYEPLVLLLDEPLSNLDAKLRLTMRTEIHGLIKKLSLTALYVTHDQEEALVLSDRIAVMKDGVIQQLDTPRAVYTNPCNKYVAGFVGQTNFFPGRVEGGRSNGSLSVACSFGAVGAAAGTHAAGEKVWVTIRPEEILLHAKDHPDRANVFPARVLRTVFVGSRIQCELEIGAERCETEVDGQSRIQAGDAVKAELPLDRIKLIGAE
jgi:iron(III) transport system ATP-binding protein